MFGPSLLVSPALRYKARTQEVVFPKCGWFDFFTGAFIEGGQKKVVDAAYWQIPLFARVGSIVPEGSVVQSTKEEQRDLVLHVFAGADASFSLYEDDGVTLDYEKGAFSRIPLKYSESEKKLTIGPTSGPFATGSRTFTVKYVTKSNPSGSAKTVSFSGAVLEVKLV
jgi:alpha-D-xyloside xylohydrolase